MFINQTNMEGFRVYSIKLWLLVKVKKITGVLYGLSVSLLPKNMEQIHNIYFSEMELQIRVCNRRE